MKQIFNSDGFYDSSFTKTFIIPQKLQDKITSKGTDVGMCEISESYKDNKQYRRNSCHHFTGKTGFYL